MSSVADDRTVVINPSNEPAASNDETAAAIVVSHLSHCYGERVALDELSIEIRRGEIFAFLGPNGGGKTTLFRILSTLLPCPRDTVRVLGHDLATEAATVRSCIGVVFQAPSLDKKLTVIENIRHQAALYGVRGSTLRQRQQQLLDQFGLSDRARERTESLSGGLRRRVELAKGMIHQPRLLLLDEPSTGLDPGARNDLWQHLELLQQEFGVTVVMTTHLLEEAEKANRIAILNQGKLVASDTPSALRATVGGDSITLTTRDATALAYSIRAQFQIDARVVDGRVRLEQSDAGVWIARLVEAFPGKIDALTLAKPSLEDVFINKTGHRFADDRKSTNVINTPTATVREASP
ncbi:MAG TPA: ABC transporter ATP-binding protein [Pirellulaceae bacterium]|nr:ABC transporter ATP-binding protein [Pirellulaceae bacterium]